MSDRMFIFLIFVLFAVGILSITDGILKKENPILHKSDLRVECLREVK